LRHLIDRAFECDAAAAESETERQQEQGRLTNRADHAGARAEIPLQLPQLQDEDSVHRRPRHTRRIMRVRSTGAAPASRMLCPVSVMNASSKVRPPVPVQSRDTANKASELSDFSVCTPRGVAAENPFLLNVLRRRIGYPDLKRSVREQYERLRPDVVLIGNSDARADRNYRERLCASARARSMARRNTSPS
jgi:hypothetical protein